MSRYEAMFARLATRGEGAFIPFAMLGDPTPGASARVLDALVAGGADALELGIPFSDPVADGPVIQAAAVRALESGTRLADCWALIRGVRDAHPELPIGLLVYANLVAHRQLGAFYGEAADAGVDSVLVADLPVDAATEFIAAARAHDISPVFIAPPNADDARLARIAAAGGGYTYVVTRAGVTGADATLRRDSSVLLTRLKALGAPPAVLGFGISTPEHVRQGLAMGAAGVISGSAVVRLVAEHHSDHAAPADALTSFVSMMKTATEKER
jgi:tryptophan synthase alpha chain